MTENNHHTGSDGIAMNLTFAMEAPVLQPSLQAQAISAGIAQDPLKACVLGSQKLTRYR